VLPVGRLPDGGRGGYGMLTSAVSAAPSRLAKMTAQ